MKESKFEIVSKNSSSYQFNIISCNPECPIKFKLDTKKKSKKWKNELTEYIGGPSKGTSPLIVSAKRSEAGESKLDENPVKVEVMRITSDQGEPTWNNAILYGYYTEKSKLNFYLNKEQSTPNLDFTVTINQENSTIEID